MSNQSIYFNKYILIGILITTTVTFSLYTINMVVLLDTTILTSGIFMPFVVGGITGYVFGFLYNQRLIKQSALFQAIEQQNILKEILLLNHQNYKLEEILERSIQLILNATFAKLQSKGGIFLTTKENRLKLISHLNFSKAMLNSCGKSGVAFGECLCGIAAKEKKTIYKDCVDSDHSIIYKNMEDHGHYSVPIMLNEHVLGVIIVYLEVNHNKNKIEINFLESAAKILAIVINKISVDEELHHHYKDIKRVNTELDQFVYSVSHDLRAPLSSILGLVNLSKNESDSQTLKEYINKIGTSTQKLDSFIKDILDYSRNSRTDIESECFSLEVLVNGLVENIRLLQNPDIKIELIVDEAIEYVGDRRRVSIILNNIISNACKYADKLKSNRYLKIKINTTTDTCYISVEDNGIGIKKSSIGNVFKMFYRGTEMSSGSGLGLYIVSEAISKLKGKVEIDSEEGVGTKIFIQLPQLKLP